MLDVLQQRACPPRASAKCVLILRAASGCVISSYDPMLLGNNTWYNLEYRNSGTFYGIQKAFHGEILCCRELGTFCEMT